MSLIASVCKKAASDSNLRLIATDFNQQHSLRLSFSRRAINRNNWSTWFVHRERFDHKSYLRRAQLAWATCIHILESQQRREYCKHDAASSRVDNKTTPEHPVDLPLSRASVLDVKMKNSQERVENGRRHRHSVWRECGSQRSWQPGNMQWHHHHNTFHIFYEPLKAAVESDSLFLPASKVEVLWPPCPLHVDDVRTKIRDSLTRKIMHRVLLIWWPEVKLPDLPFKAFSEIKFIFVAILAHSRKFK